MKHEWEELPSGDHRYPKLWFRRLRQCKHCRKVQEYEVEHLWMRVVGYYWRPLVGRCPGKPDPNTLALEVEKILNEPT